MLKRMPYRRQVGLCLLLTTLALTGCAHKDESAGTLHGTPAEVQQQVQSQAAQRAAYYNSHPTQPAQNPAYTGHP